MTKHAFLVAIDDHLTTQKPSEIVASCDAGTADEIISEAGVTRKSDTALTYRRVTIAVTDEPLWRVVWGGGDVIETLEPYDA